MAGEGYGDEDLVLKSEATYFGPSFMINWLKTDYKGFVTEVILVNCHIPTGARLVHAAVRPDASRSPRASTRRPRDYIGKKYTEMFGEGFLQDVHIWLNKAPVQNPLLCEEDGPVYQLRRWYEQFYVDKADVTPEMTERFEFEVDTTKANEFWRAEVAENLAQEGGRGRGSRRQDGACRDAHALMASFVPDQRRDPGGPAALHQARLTEVACLDCLAHVGVKKNTEHHTSIQWDAESLARRAPSSADGRPSPAGAPRPRILPAAARPASTPPSRRASSRSEPRMATELLRAEGLDVVEETADAHSIVVRGARRPGGAVRLHAGPVPDRRRALASRPALAARCYSLRQPARAPAHGHGQAHRRRLRLELDLRQPPGPATPCACCRPAGSSPPATSTPTCCSSPAARASPRSCRSPVPRWRKGTRHGRAVLRQPRREVGDLRLGAGRARRRVRRPASGRALARVGPGAADEDQLRAFAAAYSDVRRLRAAARRRS